MKGHAILVDGKLHLSVSEKLSFRATSFHYKMIFQSAARELQKIGIYTDLSILKSVYILRCWSSGETGKGTHSSLYKALLIFCSSPIPYRLALPRPWCPWAQSPTSLIFQRWGRDQLEAGWRREPGQPAPQFRPASRPPAFHCSWCFSRRASGRLWGQVICRHLSGNFLCSAKWSATPASVSYSSEQWLSRFIHCCLFLLILSLQTSVFSLLPLFQGYGGGGGRRERRVWTFAMTNWKPHVNFQETVELAKWRT